MYTRRTDIPDVEFTDFQATFFYSRWDRLRLLLTKYYFLEKSLSSAEAAQTEYTKLTTESGKTIGYVYFPIYIIYVSFAAFRSGIDEFLSDSTNSLIIATSLLAWVIFSKSREALDVFTLKEVAIKETKLEMKHILNEWRILSGGLSLHTYRTDGDETHPLWDGPPSDPNLMELKTSILSDCVRGADYQIDPELGTITWVRA
jgi:hypothetical protein